MTGLNLLNTTNLDYFNPHHQAEVFRLKGLFYQVHISSQAISLNENNQFVDSTSTSAVSPCTWYSEISSCPHQLVSD